MKKCKLAVSLLEMDYGHLARGLEEIEAAGADYVHIDVMDGRFVPSIGIGTKLIQGIRPATRLIFDVHMMVEEPARYIEKIAQAGADVITVHYEACKNIKKTLACIKELGLLAGVDLSPDTSLDVLDDELLRQADVIHLMTTYPGIEGQKFIPESLNRIAELHKRLEQLQLETDIEVDGNITMENVEWVVEAGATIIVSGRALAQGNMMKNIRQLRTIIQAAERRQ